MAVLFELANKVNAGDKHLAGQLGKRWAAYSGFCNAGIFSKPADGRLEESILSKIAERERRASARITRRLIASARNFSSRGIALEDKGGKTTWRRA